MSFSTAHDTPAARPETELLLWCCRGTTANDAERHARIQALLGEAIDWEYAIEKARRHGLLPLFYRGLKEFTVNHTNASNNDVAASSAHNSAATTAAAAAATITANGLVPDKYLRSLRESARFNQARNILLLDELKKILHSFAAANICAMPYKGPALAVLVYGDLAVRQFTDLDILVRPADVWRATRLLVEQGYRPLFDITDARRQADFLRLGYVQLFERDGGQKVVELHWAFAPRFFGFHFASERFWRRLEKFDLCGIQGALTPPAEELLVILCAHGAKDMWERLEWVCCVAELVRVRPQLDWGAVQRLAAASNVRRVVLLGLSLARSLFGARLPDAVCQEIKATPAVEGLAREICARLLGDEDASIAAAESSSPSVRQRIIFHLRGKDRVRDRARYCLLLATTPTPGDWEWLPPVPRQLSFLYSFARPFRLLKKYRTTSADQLSKD